MLEAYTSDRAVSGLSIELLRNFIMLNIEPVNQKKGLGFSLYQSTDRIKNIEGLQKYI